jgi:hypothetical protein
LTATAQAHTATSTVTPTGTSPPLRRPPVTIHALRPRRRLPRHEFRGPRTTTPSTAGAPVVLGTPSATPALVLAGTPAQHGPESTPAGAVQSQSAPPAGVTTLPSAGDGGVGPAIPWRPVTATVVILLVGAGGWVLYYGMREATAED